jgi:uncharacterized peroxidase-related enzyme
MARLKIVNPSEASGKAKELLQAVQAKLKITPNMTKALANSPAALEAYLAFNGALAGGLLDAKLREQIALAVAESNGCEYCLSAHTAIGRLVGLSEPDIAAGRDGYGSSAKATAALKFAQELVKRRGSVPSSSITALHDAGFSDGEIAEIIANVALNIFTNYFNIAGDVDIDFPRVSVHQPV